MSKLIDRLRAVEPGEGYGPVAVLLALCIVAGMFTYVASGAGTGSSSPFQGGISVSSKAGKPGSLRQSGGALSGDDKNAAHFGNIGESRVSMRLHVPGAGTLAQGSQSNGTNQGSFGGGGRGGGGGNWTAKDISPSSGGKTPSLYGAWLKGFGNKGVKLGKTAQTMKTAKAQTTTKAIGGKSVWRAPGQNFRLPGSTKFAPNPAARGVGNPGNFRF